MRHGCCVMVDDRVYKFHMQLMYGLTLAKRGRGWGLNLFKMVNIYMKFKDFHRSIKSLR